MSPITPDEVREYFKRMAMVRDFKAADLRRTSMETKLIRLASLMASRHIFSPEPDREKEVAVVRERWNGSWRALGERAGKR